MLQTFGIDPDQLRVRVEETLKPSRSAADRGEMPYTRAARRVLEYAMAESERRHLAVIGTELFLLGLVEDEKSNAAQVLDSLGAPRDWVEAEARRALDEPRDGSPPE